MKKINIMSDSESKMIQSARNLAKILNGETVKREQVCKLDAYKDGKCTLYVNKDCYKCGVHYKPD